MNRHICALALMCASFAPAQDPTLSQESLLQDARQLARILEDSHPDPYAAFGGRIAFQRSLQDLLRGLPVEGMTTQRFFDRLAPFVAGVRDGHTFLRPPRESQLKGGGLPLGFSVVEEGLVVTSTLTPAPSELLGARLLSLQCQDLPSLRARMRQIRGTENLFGELSRMATRLGSLAGLQDLLPTWSSGTPLKAAFLLPDGTRRDLELMPRGAQGEAQGVATRVRGVPDLSSRSLAWGFLASDGRTALLRLKDCVGYREAMAFYLANGVGRPRALAEEQFKTRYGRPPKDDADLLKALPSALETFGEMVQAMKGKGTQTLVVDLRDNDGGNSLIASLLVYVLHGPRGLEKLGAGYSIPRYSTLYFDNRKAGTQEALNRGRSLPLGPGDYNFDEEQAFRNPRSRGADDWKSQFKGVEGMTQELASPRLGGVYAVPRILVLCSAGTYSAGFDTACALHLTGAQLVGTPSAQAPNGFIDSLTFKLDRSGLEGSVSYQATYGFPDDPAKGRVLPCDFPLTYEAFKRLGFDPHAELLLALEAAGVGQPSQP